MRILTTALLVAAAALAARPASAKTVIGGGPTAADCYNGFEVQSENPGCAGDDKSVTVKSCNGSCTFQVQACVGLSQPTGCTATTLSTLKAGGLSLPATLGPDHACSTPTTVTVSTKKGGKKKGVKKFRMKGRASSAKPKNDADVLKLTCLPNPANEGCDAPATCDPGNTCTESTAGTKCAANPDGGPNRLSLVIGETGTDLDNGWTGSSHNFILVPNGRIDGCLTGCNSGSDTECDFAATTGAGTRSGPAFGAPLPLLAANVPVCVVSKWAGNVTGKANEGTGDISIDVHLTSEVFLTDVTAVCPQCRNNKCNGGANSGKDCTVEASVDVFISQGNLERYDLSASCPPTAPPDAALAINFVPLTSGSAATLQGPTPCTAKPGEPNGVSPPQPDACGGGGCGSACSGLACVGKIDDPVNPGTQICVDSKGGVSQLCCNNNTAKPCFTLANNGVVNRAGHPDPAAPALPDTTYPKCSTAGVLASTFCIPATGKSSIDQVTGLPGPGAIQLTGKATWSKE